jgi:hypothetical protein
MAGDWIKMRNNLWDDPRVSRLCDITGSGEAPIIGGLYWLWATADEHTADGFMPGLSASGIDRKTGVRGLGAALQEVRWIEEAEGGIRLVRFDEHNGASAKRRCMEAQRKANSRSLSASDADGTRNDGGRNAPFCGPREEKRREEKKDNGISDSSESAAAESARKRASRKCPESFSLTDEMREWAKQNHPAVNIEIETAKLRDHTFKTAITDWAGAWRNWIRKAAEYAKPPTHARPAPRSDDFGSMNYGQGGRL